MIRALYRKTLFALYQTVVVFGIVMMPIALLARRAGISIPLGRFVEAVGDAYEGTRDGS